MSTSSSPVSATLARAALAAASVFAACVGDSERQNIEQCVPGHVSFCACPSGGWGTQACDEEGRYAACDCDGASRGSGDTGVPDADAGPDTAPPEDVSGHDEGTDAGADAEVRDAPDGVSEVGADAIVPSGDGELGDPCDAGDDCASGLCGQFGTGWVCTEACVVSCESAEYTCFNRVCTPLDHCDLSTGDEGVGPGCDDARCGGCGPNQTCEGFRFGRYECVCTEGWQADGLGGCEDFDECAAGTGTCGVGTVCSNTVGTYTCVCGPGYFGETCTECPGGAANVCFGRGTCDDGPTGTGACTCLPRYSGDDCDQECFDLIPATCLGADLTGAAVAGRDFTDGDFTGSIVAGVDLSAVNFTRADLTDVRGPGAIVTDALLSNATVTNLDLSLATGLRAVFDQSAGEGLVLSGADLSDASLQNVTFIGVDAIGTIMPRANITGANLGEGDFAEATLNNLIGPGADIRNANFTVANLSESNLSNAFATGANFTGATLTSTNLQEANISTSQMNDAVLGGANLQLAILRGVVAIGANFGGVTGNGVSFIDANLTGANFAVANLTIANFTGANLTNATLTGALMTTSNVTRVIWSNTACPDGTNSDAHSGTCVGHLTP